MNRKYILVALFSFFALLHLSAKEDYIYWYTPSGYDGKTASGEEADGKPLLAHATLPFGTKVEVTVGGETAVLTVNDRPLDKRALLGTDVKTAKTLGFYPFLRENTDMRIVSYGDERASSQRKSAWYTIAPLYPKNGETVIDTAVKLIADGYKAEVSENGEFVEVKFIPEYQLQSEIETLKEYVDNPSAVKATKMP